MTPELHEYGTCSPIYESLVSLLQKRATDGRPMPTTIDLSPYAFSLPN